MGCVSSSPEERIDTDHWDSHLPVLRSLGKQFSDIKTVIEFGCGLHSTMCFLDKNYFPYVEKLYSYEKHQGWLDYLSKLIGDDSRWVPLLLKKGFIMPSKRTKCDLLFIDGNARKKTINAWSRTGRIIAMHDTEKKKFRNLLLRKNKYLYNHIPSYKTHWTSIASNEFNITNFKINKEFAE